MARKMILVPEEVLKRLQSGSSSEKSLQIDTTLELQSDPSDVISRRGLNNTEKINIYNHKLQQHVNQNAKRNSAKLETKNWDTEIASSIPSYILGESITLYKWLQHSSLVKFTDRGELIYRDRPLAGSHIIDLLAYAAPGSKKSKNVIGSEEFYEYLKNENVPRSIYKDRSKIGIKKKTILKKTKTSRTRKITRPSDRYALDGIRKNPHDYDDDDTDAGGEYKDKDMIADGDEEMVGNGFNSWIVI